MEVKALELECMEEGFIRDFLKGVRLVLRKTGVEFEGLTHRQASDDSSSYSDGDEMPPWLRKRNLCMKTFELNHYIDEKISDKVDLFGLSFVNILGNIYGTVTFEKRHIDSGRVLQHYGSAKAKL
ncbi:hypothetical protein IEQ34_019772 [Dendrobium chrysotoxum]|uniref:Uncharacterized protein n=1 Tax=Dendrobium chrysotoxum TaxID=161865 RepID=A0AAV7G9X1_DENCH|nr:hypothetical protein IEQ34_019772 [Dendrobium chrysotoxum]